MGLENIERFGKHRPLAGPSNALVIGFPEGGGGPRADVGEYGDFMGTLQQISSLVVGEMWGLRFLNALLSGKIWGLRLCSTERRLGTIFVCSIDGKMAEENKKVCFKIHCFFVYQTDHPSKVCMYL